jgi:peptidase E
MVDEPCIVAIGGAGLGADPDDTLIDDYIFRLSGKDEPRLCYIPTAGGDSDAALARFYSIFSQRHCRPSHLALFNRTVVDIETFLMAQDVIYVGGGNTANMLAIWRIHGVDAVLGKAWREGIVLCGTSAGGICWFEGGTTDSFGKQLAPLADGLGLLKGSFSPHYDGEALRRPVLHDCLAKGTLPSGVAADNGAGLRYAGTELAEAICWRPEAKAWRVELTAEGVKETALPTRYIGDAPS